MPAIYDERENDDILLGRALVGLRSLSELGATYRSMRFVVGLARNR